MSRFEVTIKDIDLDTDDILKATRVNDMQKVPFSSIDSIHVSSQGNIGTIIFDDDAEFFPAFDCYPQDANNIGHSYEITIKTNSELDRLLVAKTTEIIFSENFRKYAKQCGAINLIINDNDKNEIRFNIDGVFGIQPVMLIFPTTQTQHNYVTYEIVED